MSVWLILFVIICVVIIALAIARSRSRRVRGGNGNRTSLEQATPEEAKKYLNESFYDKRVSSKLQEGKTKQEAKAYARKAVDDAVKNISDPDSGYYVFNVLSSDEPVGAFYIYINNEREVAFIHHFEIYKSHRGQGLSVPAINALKDMLAEDFPLLKILRLSVDADNEIAQHVYNKAGFQTTSYSMNLKLHL